MKQLAFPSLIATALLTACAGNTLSPQGNDSFSVKSQPAGATVYVMGEELGTTPLEVPTTKVFPVTFPIELQEKYGKVELTHSECQPYVKSVSTRVLADGLNAKLDCAQPSVQAADTVAKGDIEGRLLKLKALRDKGLITEEEYNTKRQAILQEL